MTKIIILEKIINQEKITISEKIIILEKIFILEKIIWWTPLLLRSSSPTCPSHQPSTPSSS